MKRVFVKVLTWLWLALLITACSGTGAPLQTPSPAALSQLTRVRIGVDASLAPFEALGATNNSFVGLDIDLMQAIAAQAGLKVEFVNMDFNRLVQAIGQCRLDAGISAIRVTDTLAQQMDFTEPYYTAGQVVVVKKGNLTISGRDGLSGMTVGTEAGTGSGAGLDQLPVAEPKTYPSFFRAFQDLSTGYIDAVIADKPRALSFVKIKPNNLKIVGDEFGQVNYAIAICKQQVGLGAKIKNGLAAVKAAGTLNQLTQKWLASGQK